MKNEKCLPAVTSGSSHQDQQFQTHAYLLKTFFKNPSISFHDFASASA